MSMVNIAAKADFLLGVLLLIAAIYMTFTQSYLLAFILGASSAMSFAFVRIKPSRWIARRILISRLKS